MNDDKTEAIEEVTEGSPSVAASEVDPDDDQADATPSRQFGRNAILLAGGAVAVVLLVIALLTFVRGGKGISGYDDNLEMILAQTGRNTNHDESPFSDTPQDELDISDASPLITLDRGDYLSWGQVGSDYLHQEFAFPVETGGQFRIACEFSHFAYDDPILSPGEPGGSHLHMFFGNTDINAFTTYETMRDSGASTCNGGELNRSGYWAPAMMDPDPSAPGGAWVRVPERVVVYYKGELLANGSNPEAISGGAQVYRPGMANVAPQPGIAALAPEIGGLAGSGSSEWKCSNNYSVAGDPESVGELPICFGDRWVEADWQWTVLEMEVRFPNCFNTTKADDDWTAWETVGPNDWFVANCTGELGADTWDDTYEVFPHLEYFVNYRVDPGEDTSDWFLASDVDPVDFSVQEPRGSTLHADWWGAWHPKINEEWIDNCVNTGWAPGSGQTSGCGFGYLSDGGSDYESPLPGRALVRRPEWNGDYKIPLQTLFEELCEPNNPAHSYSTPETGAHCRG